MKKVFVLLLSIIVLITSCSKDDTQDKESKPAEVVEEKPKEYWVTKMDSVDDFGDRQFIATNEQMNSANQRIEMIVACTNGLFEVWLETDEFIPDIENQAAKIRLDSDEPVNWAIDRRAAPSSGVFAVRLKKSKDFYSSILLRDSVSVKLNGEGNSFIAATFPLNGVKNLGDGIARAGCKN
jgi:hypothetical protein